MKKIAYITLLIALLFGMGLSGCNKLIEIGVPKNQLASNSIFSDTSTAEAAVAGMYSIFANGNPGLNTGTATTLYNMLSADEAYCYAYTFYDDFTNNSLTSQVYYIDGYWTGVYNVIYNANAIIEGAPASSLPDSYKGRITGEAKFIRAMCYFYLVNEYGAIPLVASTDVHTTTSLPRDSVNTVYDRIEKDLTDALSVLPSDFSLYGSKKIRATTWAAQALLARVYLYRGKWSQAESAASAVIGNPGLFKMTTDLGQTFLANSSEGILQTPYPFTSSWTATNIGTNPTSLIPSFVLDSGLNAAFEPGDLRKAAWVGIKAYGGADYPLPNKYRYRSATDPVEYSQVLRLSEQYLIRAEARMQQGKFPDAASDLDAVRTRAGLANTTAADKPALTAAIEQEDRIEFFCEWGHRWMDLKRWPGITNPAVTRADEVLSALKGSKWQSTDALYPIPQPEINANPALTQNPGYN